MFKLILAIIGFVVFLYLNYKFQNRVRKKLEIKYPKLKEDSDND